MRPSDAFAPFVCRPVTAALGAEVESPGVDLAAPLSSQVAGALRGALDAHLVLFFRGLNLDDAAHRRLAAALGTPMVHPFERAMGRADPIHGIVDKPEDEPDRAGWHTDDSYLERPPAYALLRCEVAPEVGGDTAWCNMILAYERLSDAMRRFVDGLVGLHATEGRLLDYIREHLPPGQVESAIAEIGSGALHPIVRVQPGSGRRALFFEPNFMRRVDGLSDVESEFVRSCLIETTHNVSLQCRFRWREGDLAIWDQRATQHIGSADHRGQLRVLRRCTVEGERPFGPARPPDPLPDRSASA